MDEAIAHCFERDAVVGERGVSTEALRRSLGDAKPEVVLPQQQALHGVIVREIDGRRWATTPEAIRQERDVLDLPRRGRNRAAALNPTWKIERTWLSQEQQRAVQQLLHSKDVLQILRGGTGTGKTALMQEAVAAI